MSNANVSAKQMASMEENGVFTVIENPKLQVEMEPLVNGRMTLRAHGVLDEDTNFSPILTWVEKFGSQLRTIKFDLGAVDRMNSCGVRSWLWLMDRLQNVTCNFTNVSVAFIEQANMISNTFGRKGAKVESFHAPYFCSKCNEEKQVVLKPEQVTFLGDKTPIPPSAACPKCSTIMQFDSIAEEYFGFIGH